MSSAEAAAAPKMIVLKSSDGKTFEVEEAVFVESQTIKQMIEVNCAVTGIPLPNVTSKILAKVIEYCKKQADASAKAAADGALSAVAEKAPDDDLKAFDTEFMKVDKATLFDLLMAADYLNIKSLLDLTCKTANRWMWGKTPEEIRKIFNIKNDFTPEEEKEMSRKYQMAYVPSYEEEEEVSRWAEEEEMRRKNPTARKNKYW